MASLNVMFAAEEVTVKPSNYNSVEVTLEVEDNEFFGAVETEDIALWAQSEKKLKSLILSLRENSGNKAILDEFSDEELLEYFVNERTLGVPELEKFYAAQMEEWAHENGWIKKGEEYE